MAKRRLSGIFRRTSVLPWVLYILFGTLVLLLQSAPRLFPVIAGARPVPIVLFAVCTAMFEGITFGTVAGLLVGLLWGAFSPRLFGFDALVLMLIALAVGLLVDWIIRTNFWSALLLCTGGILVQMLLEWLCTYAVFQHEDTFAMLLRVYLPNALYTAVLIPVAYGLHLVAARLTRRLRKG